MIGTIVTLIDILFRVLYNGEKFKEVAATATESLFSWHLASSFALSSICLVIMILGLIYKSVTAMLAGVVGFLKIFSLGALFVFGTQFFNSAVQRNDPSLYLASLILNVIGIGYQVYLVVDFIQPKKDH